MSDRGLLDLIILRLPGLSCRDKISLCETFSGEDDITGKSPADIEAIIGHKLTVPTDGLHWDIDVIRKEAEHIAKASRLRGITITAWPDGGYPPLLREMYDPPPVLFYRGTLPNPAIPLAAIVGTRKPSPQAAAQAFTVARELSQGGIPVVSGLALGIDSMAHRGCLEGESPTVAVLGSGVDSVYPASNRNLARRILETGGALVSEYPPGTGPRKWTFPARNRIISGLSRGVLIVEAPEKSGALITARFALEQNRELWVASSGITGEGQNPALFDKRGTEKLAADGAEIIRAGSDILRLWGLENSPGTELKTATGAPAFAAACLST